MSRSKQIDDRLLDALTELDQQNMEKAIFALGGHFDVERRKSCLTAELRAGAYLWVAETQNGALGYLEIKQETADTAHILSIQVSPAQDRYRRGRIVLALAAAAFADLATHQEMVLRAETFLSLPKILELERHLGFRKVGEDPGRLHMEGRLSVIRTRLEPLLKSVHNPEPVAVAVFRYII